MFEYDAIAVGGGVAGPAFALKLARAGARVALIERTLQPTLKVCGDFLSGEAQELLAHLGLDLASLGAVPIGTLRLAAGKSRAEAPLPFVAVGLSRLRLDEALLEQAALAGVEVIRGETASGLEPLSGGVAVRVGDKTVTARSVALATGKHNLRGFPRAPASLAAYKIQLEPSEFTARDLQGIVQVVGYRGGYLGACLVEGGAVSICWLADERAMRELGSDWRGQLAFICRSVPVAGELLQGARYLTERPAAVGGVPFGYRRHTPIAPNIYPVGDQLSVIPSVTGDGTSLALSSGIAAAQAILAGQEAPVFQQRFLAGVRTQFLCAGVIDSLSRTVLTRAIGIRAVSMLPAIARVGASLTRVRNASRFADAGGA
jgi:hypothetical protein